MAALLGEVRWDAQRYPTLSGHIVCGSGAARDTLAGDESSENRYVSSKATMLSGDCRGNYLRWALLM